MELDELDEVEDDVELAVDEVDMEVDEVDVEVDAVLDEVDDVVDELLVVLVPVEVVVELEAFVDVLLDEVDVVVFDAVAVPDAFVVVALLVLPVVEESWTDVVDVELVDVTESMLGSSITPAQPGKTIATITAAASPFTRHAPFPGS